MGNKQQLQANNAKLSESLEEINTLPQKHTWTRDTVITPGDESITIPAYTDKELTVEAIASSYLDLTKFGYAKAAAGTITFVEEGQQSLEIYHHLGSTIKMLIMELIEPTTYIYQQCWLIFTLSVSKLKTDEEKGIFSGGGQVKSGGSETFTKCEPKVTFAKDVQNDTHRFYAPLVQDDPTSYYTYFNVGTYRWLVLA